MILNENLMFVYTKLNAFKYTPIANKQHTFCLMGLMLCEYTDTHSFAMRIDAIRLFFHALMHSIFVYVSIN